MKKSLLPFLFFLSLQLSAQISNVPFMEYAYENKGCSGFKYGDGSLIFVPNDAFCMEDGSACNGAIKIKYREFHTQTDMLVSGLNMILSRGGKNLILESAGMFELRAECNGKPMKLCEGKSIQVRMKCRRNLPNLEGFVYDEKGKRWIDYDQVYDFSYNKANPKNDYNNWGNAPQNGDPIQVFEAGSDGMETYKELKNIANDLPDGYFKGMNLKTLGIFNYDGVIKDKDAIPMIPEFAVNTGEAIGETVYVAYAGRNTLVTYYASDFETNFVLLNTKGIKIFTKLKDGSYAILPEGFLDKANIKLMQGTKQKFVLEKQPKKPKTKAELAAVTKISNT
ncbi:MAG: hypothetical protein K0S33_4207 [Bacteroidetes bacterium]|jgi:hypothetical protein|nr:hypothetical protein [Bacteroidota bacterium]